MNSEHFNGAARAQASKVLKLTKPIQKSNNEEEKKADQEIYGDDSRFKEMKESEFKSWKEDINDQ